MTELSVARINQENARRMRRNLFDHHYAWSGWSGEHYRRKWRSARRFFVGFKPVLFKGNNRTFVVDVGTAVHEAPYGVRLAVSGDKKLTNLMSARISIEGKEVTIRSIQGEPIVDVQGYQISRTNLGALREFEELNGPAANCLFKEIKMQAKRLGYAIVILQKPQFTASYICTMITRTWKKRLTALSKKLGDPLEAERLIRTEIRERLVKFYEKIADAEKMEDCGEYWQLKL
jgi:hypothetical protein